MNQPAHSRRLRLLRTEPHSCSYLDNRIAVTEFVAPDEEVDSDTYQGINELAFRRSGIHYYRPSCPDCQQCQPLRVEVDKFTPSRNQRRCLRKNLDLNWSIHETADLGRYYPLYENYIGSRHQDGDMYPASGDQFENFIARGCSNTRYIEFNSTELEMVAVCDLLPEGLSAIYSFFATDQPERSLGTLAILVQIQIARQLGLPWVYLGYWISDSQKMAYKTRFKPNQVLVEGRWTAPES